MFKVEPDAQLEKPMKTMHAGGHEIGLFTTNVTATWNQLEDLKKRVVYAPKNERMKRKICFLDNLIRHTLKACRVKKVVDGDSVEVAVRDSRLSVRIFGIDTPEFEKPYREEAKQFLADLVAKKDVDLEIKDVDHYGRIVAILRLGDTRIDHELVRNGLAWHHVEYSSDKTLAELEQAAKTEKLNIWSQDDPHPPWAEHFEWLKNLKMETAPPRGRRIAY